MKLSVTVTEKHLQKARSAQDTPGYDVCSECLISQALNDTPGVTNAETAYTRCDFKYNGKHHDVSLPREVSRLVSAFDSRDYRNAIVLPITFELDVTR